MISEILRISRCLIATYHLSKKPIAGGRLCIAPHCHRLKKESDQVNGLISTGQLNTLLYLYTQPINPVVCRESHRDTSS
jgi:hypothetical protein